MINFEQATTAWNALYEAQIRPVQNEREYLAMLEFLRELIRNENVDTEPYKSLWATAAQFAATWEQQNDPWVLEFQESEARVL